jgi:hypothetical protein
MNDDDYHKIIKTINDLRTRISRLEEKLDDYNIEEKIRSELKIYGLLEKNAEDE